MAGRSCLSEEGFSPWELAAGRVTGLGTAMLPHRQNGWQGQGEHPLLTLLLQIKEGMGMPSKSPVSTTLLQQALAEQLQRYRGGTVFWSWWLTLA